MSAYVQLVDPGSRFEHKEGTLTHDAVLRLPLDAQVKRGLQGRILRRVEAPATEAADVPADSPIAPAVAPISKNTPATK